MFQELIDPKWLPESLSKEELPEMHYVSWTPYTPNSMSGYGSMMWQYAVTLFQTGMSEKEMCRTFNLVDSQGETGTFYPKANVTMLPSQKRRCYEQEEIMTQLKDVKAAHTMMNAKRIYWDFRSLGADFYKENIELIKQSGLFDECDNYLIGFEETFQN